MTTRAPDRRDTTPAALRAPVLAAFWAEATAFVSHLFEMFSVTRLRTTGISRQRGAMLSIFLLNIEGGIRRIILAAALAFTPPALAARTTTQRLRNRNSSSKPPGTGFRLIRLASEDPTPAIPTQLAARRRPPASRPYGHIPFPADPLLALPRAPQAIGHVFALPTRNPLDRWGRLSRRDPDWLPPDSPDCTQPRPDEENSLDAAHDDDAPTPRRRKRKRPQTSEGLPDSLYDWRRRYDALTHPIPAPDFAARLEALQRIIANPQALITRTARRLQASRSRVRIRARERPLNQTPPRRARHIQTAGYMEDFARRAHTRLVDTS